jgi:hypothetical protein
VPEGGVDSSGLTAVRSRPHRSAATYDLRAWVAHLDTLGIEHSPIISALAGQLLIFRDPDQTYLHLLTLPEGGIQAIKMNHDAAEPEGPWIAPDIMRHP